LVKIRRRKWKVLENALIAFGIMLKRVAMYREILKFVG